MSLEHERQGGAPQPRRRTITPLSTPALSEDDLLLFPLDRKETTALVKAALDEDDAFNDVTTIATVLSDRRERAAVVSRSDGVVCGVPLAIEAFKQLDPNVTLRIDVEDGGRVRAGTPVLFITGHARGILSAERVALNFMQRLSGVASITAKYVDVVAGTGAQILDTRKTTPGWRRLEKYAVRCGGGRNHRLNLGAAVLIKDNHLASVDGDVALAVRRARDMARRGTKVEVECDSIEQVEAAVQAGADIVMLDNMSPAKMKECVLLVGGRAITEASGGVRLDTVRAIAESGVNWISVGALTHSAPALDLGLDFD